MDTKERYDYWHQNKRLILILLGILGLRLPGAGILFVDVFNKVSIGTCR
ncbi:MAG: DUF4212 domain-containing protein, partial [Candidatus Competibacteraceae bacterium]|nr:DUF4212 domain-containing protein [Candidatus Competibacteraceae bacterium]